MYAQEKWQELLSWFQEASGYKIGDYVATGSSGIIFNNTVDRLVKFSDMKIGNISKVANKNLPGIVDIYDYGVIKVSPKFQVFDGQVYFHMNKGVDSNLYIDLSDDDYMTYIVMEKLNTNIREHIILAHKAYIAICDSELLEQYYMDFDIVEDVLDVLDTYNVEEFLMRYNSQRFIANDGNITIVFEFIKKLVEDNHNEKRGLEMILQLKEIIDSVQQINKQFKDFHFDQLGVDGEGNLKIFDIFSTDIHQEEIVNVIGNEEAAY